MFDLDNLPDPEFGPTGRVVFERTYSRTKANGERESWAETVARVVTGNLRLVYGEPETWSDDVVSEARELFDAIYHFRILPAGRHLWASGVPGRQFLFNCHAAGWGERLSDHFVFTFLRLMEGGGVGANFSSIYTSAYGAPKRRLRVHIVSEADHDDYAAMADAGVLSDAFSPDWYGGLLRVEDSREGWAEALADLIDTFYKDDVRHEDRVYDVSLVRPEGARLRTFGGTASGPLPLARMLLRVAEVLNSAYENGVVSPLDAMSIAHAIGECVVAGGVRRSARMSIVSWDDPYIFDFIEAKRDGSAHWTTNLSVAIDDEFLTLAASDSNTSRALRARTVLRAVVHGMLTDGEPGLWNYSLSQKGEVGEVITTNPCGEIPLEPWEACNLGHVNMEAFADDLDGLKRAHYLMTRFLIRATFGDVTSPEQAEVLRRNRRIGVGHFGVQGWLVRTGSPYSPGPRIGRVRSTLAALQRTVRETARDYAFTLRIPEPVKVTTVAPTGSVAKLPGATEGIHPIYAKWFIRRVRFSMLRKEEQAQVEHFRSQGYRVERDLYAPNTVVVEFPTKERLLDVAESLGMTDTAVEDVSEIPLRRVLAFQAMYQEDYVDNAISMTVNLQPAAYTAQEVFDALVEYMPHLKGVTIMVDGTRPQAPYERLDRSEFESLTGTATVDDSYDEACASGACPIR